MDINTKTQSKIATQDAGLTTQTHRNLASETSFKEEMDKFTFEQNTSLTESMSDNVDFTENTLEKTSLNTHAQHNTAELLSGKTLNIEQTPFLTENTQKIQITKFNQPSFVEVNTPDIIIDNSIKTSLTKNNVKKSVQPTTPSAIENINKQDLNAKNPLNNNAEEKDLNTEKILNFVDDKKSLNNITEEKDFNIEKSLNIANNKKSLNIINDKNELDTKNVLNNIAEMKKSQSQNYQNNNTEGKTSQSQNYQNNNTEGKTSHLQNISNKKELTNHKVTKNTPNKKDLQNNKKITANNSLKENMTQEVSQVVNEVITNVTLNPINKNNILPQEPQTDEMQTLIIANQQLADIALMTETKISKAKITDIKKDNDSIKVDYSSVKMDKEDAIFFTDLIQDTEKTLQTIVSYLQTEAEQKIQKVAKNVKVSSTLLNALSEAVKTNQPMRIEFDKDVSIIIKIDKDGALNAKFIPGDKAVEEYLKQNILSLKQRFDEQEINYRDLSYSNRQKQNQENRKNKKENDHE